MEIEKENFQTKDVVYTMTSDVIIQQCHPTKHDKIMNMRGYILAFYHKVYITK